MNDEVKRKVLEHLLQASDKPVAVDDVTPAMSLREDLDFNSLSAVELVMELEEAFGVEVSDEELAELKTVGDVFAMIEGKQAAQAKEGA